MTRLFRPFILLGLTLLTASALPAQGINGKWLTEFERSVRNDNGEVSAGDKVKARMTLQQKGDSVTGTWELVDPPNPNARSRQLRGTIAGNKVTLNTEFDATVNMNGEESTRKIIVVYDFTVDGDKLNGTITQKSMEMAMPSRPFSALREATK